jgi:hypothetical protein
MEFLKGKAIEEFKLNEHSIPMVKIEEGSGNPSLQRTPGLGGFFGQKPEGKSDQRSGSSQQVPLHKKNFSIGQQCDPLKDFGGFKTAKDELFEQIKKKHGANVAEDYFSAKPEQPHLDNSA